MKRKFALAVIFCVATASAGMGRPSRAISGKITCKGKQTGTAIVKLYKLYVSSEGQVTQLSKREIYGAAEPFRTIRLQKPGSYTFSDLSAGQYSVLAFDDTDGNGELSFNRPEPFGWFSSEPAGGFEAINITKSDVNNADFKLRVPTHFPKKDKRIEHGALRWIKGLAVLQLWGSSEERGFAHGYLVGGQIIDFLKFYVIEDSWKSAKRYEEIFVPFLKSHLNCPAEFLAECRTVIEGMRASGIDMRVESLGRDFELTDLLAINAYIEKRAAFEVPVPSSCTQFAFWGAQTEASEVGGGLIAGRNMDGECDVRKVTVSHFLVFAVEPSEPGRKRWVSTMWPGFVGTISGVNDDGLYSMENAGGSGPGPVVGGIVPCSWVQRYILENQGSGATAESILKMMQKFRSKGGGVTTPGSIILWAAARHKQSAPAFVYEGDRFGGAMRMPTDVRPNDATNIMAANHHLVYGCDRDRPGCSFGKEASFSSRWRYEVGMNMVEAWSRQKKPIGIAEMKQLLQTVAHGTTEYSVIFLANEKRIFIAVDDLKCDMWDAPFMNWVEFEFDELFSG